MENRERDKNENVISGGGYSELKMEENVKKN